MKQADLKNGDVYTAFVRFAEDIHNDVNPKGKIRPVIIFEDPEEGKLYACKVSTKVDKPIKRRLGYVLEDWKEAGFKAPSVIACDKENIHEIDSTSIDKFIGRLTERDLKGMLIKHIKVVAMEYKKNKEKGNSLER